MGEGKTKSCAQFSFAADSGQTTRSKWRGPCTLTAGEDTYPRMANVDLECLLPYATLPYLERDLILRVNCITWTCLQLLACVGPLHHVGPSYDTPRWGHGAAAAKPPNRTPPTDHGRKSRLRGRSLANCAGNTLIESHSKIEQRSDEKCIISGRGENPALREMERNLP